MLIQSALSYSSGFDIAQLLRAHMDKQLYSTVLEGDHLINVDLSVKYHEVTYGEGLLRLGDHFVFGDGDIVVLYKTHFTVIKNTASNEPRQVIFFTPTKRHGSLPSRVDLNLLAEATKIKRGTLDIAIPWTILPVILHEYQVDTTDGEVCQKDRYGGVGKGYRDIWYKTNRTNVYLVYTFSSQSELDDFEPGVRTLVYRETPGFF